MKRCPTCNRQYKDDTLRFCLDDGSTLTPTMRDEAPATEILPRAQPTLQFSGQTVQAYQSNPATQTSEVRRANPLLTGGVIAIALLLLLLVGIVGYFVLTQSRSKATNQASANATPTPGNGSLQTSKATPDAREEVSSTSPAGAPLKITASSSSMRLAVQSNTYYAANAIDGKRTTAWIEGVDGPGIGEWIRFDFDRQINLHRILIQPGYFKSPQIWAQNNRLATVRAEFSDGTSRQLTFDNVMQSQKVDVGATKTRWVRLTIASVYYGSDPDTAVSEIAFEWEP